MLRIQTLLSEALALVERGEDRNVLGLFEVPLKFIVEGTYRELAAHLKHLVPVLKAASDRLDGDLSYYLLSLGIQNLEEVGLKLNQQVRLP